LFWKVLFQELSLSCFSQGFQSVRCKFRMFCS